MHRNIVSVVCNCVVPCLTPHVGHVVLGDFWEQHDLQKLCPHTRVLGSLIGFLHEPQLGTSFGVATGA